MAKANAAGAAYINFAFDNPESYRLMFEITQGGAESEYAELVRAADRARETMTRHVHPLIEAGVLTGDADLIGHVFWAGLHGVVMLQLANKLTLACDFDSVFHEMFRALTAGFAPKD